MDRVALLTEQVVEQLATGGIVVDHRDARGHGGLLSRNQDLTLTIGMGPADLYTRVLESRDARGIHGI
jgi:hypothetical protein